MAGVLATVAWSQEGSMFGFVADGGGAHVACAGTARRC